MTAPLDILGLTSDGLVSEARARLPRGAGFARAVYRSAAREGRLDPDALGMSAVARAAWAEHFRFALPEVVRTVEEPGPFGTTRKAVLRAADGLEYECVSIPMARDHATLCLSSQIGCKMACSFCETGRMGLLRNLSAAEIVGQVVVARSVLGWPVHNLVFMGMGEALDNVDALIPALRALNDRRGLAIGQQRITVCTVGHVEGLEALSRLGWPRLNVSVSLNAADDALRSRLMPINRKTPLDALIAALEAYAPRRNFVVGVNYCLLPGINDAPEDARGVAAICRRLGRALVNLIPYNPGGAPITRAPTEVEVEAFIEQLEAEGAMVRRRRTKGRSVMAACGQLGNVELRRVRRPRDDQRP